MAARTPGQRSTPGERIDQMGYLRDNRIATNVTNEGLPAMNEADAPTTEPWEELAELLEAESTEPLDPWLEDRHPQDLALVVSRLDESQRTAMISRLSPESAADLLEQLPLVQAVQLVEEASPEDAAAIVDHLPSDHQADLLTELDEADAEAILRQMTPTEAASARRLSEYEDYVAGGLMGSEYLRYRMHQTVADVLADLEAKADEYRDYEVQYAYVCDRDGTLRGVLRMRDLLLAKRRVEVGEVMIDHPLSVRDETPLEDLHQFFEEHSFLGVPVVSAEGVLVGVLQRRAVDEAWTEWHDRAYMKSRGIVSGEEIRSMPLWPRTSRRMVWLVGNIGLNLVAASIISYYEATLEAVIALALFLPIISDMSGNVGSQAAAVTIRELILGVLRPRDALRVIRSELLVGLINGVVVGVILGIVAWVWKGNFALGAVICMAMSLNTLISGAVGGVTPLLLRRFGADPAVASGPLLTTVTDMCGFFMVLGIATALLQYLV